MKLARSTSRPTSIRTIAAGAAAIGVGLLAATHAAASYGSPDGTLTLSAYHGPAGAPLTATYVWQSAGACNAGQKAAFYWDYQFQHSYTWYRGMAPFVLHNNVCAATLTFPPGYGDDDPGAHDVTAWDTQFGPVDNTWIYYQTNQPAVQPTPSPTPAATPTPTPHPTPTPTTSPDPSPPSVGQSSGGTGGSGATGSGDAATGGVNAAVNDSGHAATLAASTTAAQQSGASVWIFVLAGIAVLGAAGGVLVGRRIAR